VFSVIRGHHSTLYQVYYSLIYCVVFTCTRFWHRQGVFVRRCSRGKLAITVHRNKFITYLFTM